MLFRSETLALVEVDRDERVGEELEEGGSELGVLDGDEVEEARSVLGGLDGTHVASGDSVQAHDVGAAEVVLAKVLDASLSDRDRVGNEVVESSAGSRDGHVVLVVDSA